MAEIGKPIPPCCSDYTEALTAHGLANGVAVRERQSAEHTMAEFWAPDLAQWIAVDLIANRYWVDDAGRPLSFTQLQQTFERSGEPAFRPISRNLPAAPVEPTPEAAWYARVLPAMGLVAGDDDPQRRSDIARIPLVWPYNQVVGGLVGLQRPVWITARAADRLPTSFWQLRLRLRLGVAGALLAAALSLLLAGRWIRSTRRAAARARAPRPAG
ncbi:MAG: hypothetical protein IT204_08115 [Fimbriimonadaceae bacterium]|nr:hypothetical protein [Fimbriimonadaceae bacterium]